MPTAKAQDKPIVEPVAATLASRLGDALKAPGEESDRAFASARKSLLGATWPEATSQSIKALIWLVEHEHGNGRLDVAAKAATRALALAEQTGETPSLRHASSVKGIIACETADLPGSICSFWSAASYAERAQDRRGEVVAWVNLASPYLEANLENWSLACGRRGLDLMDAVPEGDDASLFHGLFSTLYSNIAGAALRLEDYRTGLRAVQRAEKHLAAFPANSVNELVGATETHTHYARLLTALNLLDSAATHVRRASDYADRSGKKGPAVAVELARGLLEVKQGEVETGLKRLQDAAALSKDHRSISQSLRALAEAHVMARAPEVAISFYRELAAHTRRWHREGLERRIEAEAEKASDAIGEFAFACLDQLVALAELREDPSGAHPQRVGRLAYRLAKAIGEVEPQALAIERGARLLDLGKIGITSDLLLRRDELDADQRRLVQEHSAEGGELVPQSVAEYATVVAAVRWHHERFDGSGYPDGLAGEAIPLAARIAAVADAFDSLTHRRTRREALSADQAVVEMSNMPGVAFDPEVLKALTKVLGELRGSGASLDKALQAGANEPTFLAVHRQIEQALRGAQREGLPPSLLGT